MQKYPEVLDKNKVGKYAALSHAGGGYVWDDVLEYRVWCHPEKGAQDLEGGNDYYYAFDNYNDAEIFSKNTAGADHPIALILQKEYISEPKKGEFIHMKEERITEWPVEFLKRPKRTQNTIPDFMSPDAPPNKFEILRGIEE